MILTARTRRALWLFGVAAVLWLADIFFPGLIWLTHSVLRENPVRFAHVEVVIPRGWAVLKSDFGIVASKHECITTFCSESPSEKGAGFGISWDPRLTKLKAVSQGADIRLMEKDGLRQTGRPLFKGASGDIECLEGIRDRPREAQSHCYFQSDLDASFAGDPDDLPVFYEAVKSARPY